MICTRHSDRPRICYLFLGWHSSANFIAKPRAGRQNAAAHMKTTIRHFVIASAGLAVMACIALAEAPAKLPPVDVILKRNIKALGGVMAMRKLKNREARGKIRLEDFGAEMPVILRHAAPNKEAMELTIEGLGTVRDVFAGKKGWTETPDGRIIEKKERELLNKKIDADFHAYLNFKKTDL